MEKFNIGDIPHAVVRRALEENIALDPAKHKAAYNMSILLAYTVQQIGRLQMDVGLLHNKLQPILTELAREICTTWISGVSA